MKLSLSKFFAVQWCCPFLNEATATTRQEKVFTTGSTITSQQQNTTLHRRRRAFTLIEILIVVAIIGILAAILFPVFARARANARRVHCVSNLKQLALAVFQYTQDHDEKLPPQQTKASQMGGQFGIKGTESWDWSTTALEGHFYWQQLLLPYHKSTLIWFCPESTYRRNGGVYNYGANAQVIRSFNATVTTTLSSSELTSPSNTYMLMDYSNANAFRQYFNAGHEPPVTGPAYYIPGSGAVSAAANNACKAIFGGSPLAAEAILDCNAGRHFGGVNMTFADGHVKWLKSAQVYNEAAKLAVPTSCTANCSVYAGGAWDPRNP